MSSPADPDPRIVLVETSAAVPGLFSFGAWDALRGAAVVHARDPEGHPSAPYLYHAGIGIEPLAPASVPASGMDLLAPGVPSERGLARTLCDVAEERGEVVYLLGPADDELGRTVGIEAARRHIEVEFVFLAELPPGAELLRLAGVMRRLRDADDGCPWDLEQDHRSLARYLVEETYELLDAVDRDDDRDLREELGDVLLQVVFHAQIAADRRAFTIDDVAAGISEKLERRHPHVFGDTEVSSAADVQANWDDLKQQEKGRAGPFEGVPMALPALQLTTDLQRKAAKLGFDWDGPDGPAAKVREELDEVLAVADGEGAEAEAEAEIGDLLGAVVALARQLGIDPEAAARRAAARFRSRFEGVLELASSRGLEPGELEPEQWESLWREAAERFG